MNYTHFAPALAFTLLAVPTSALAADPVQPCYIQAEVRQDGRVSLDVTKYAKDHFNATTFILPVACSKAKTLYEGEEIVDKFRWGSLLTEGSVSSWNLRVKSIPRIANPDPSVCMTTLKLSQASRFSINPLTYIKDAANAQEFDWPMSCTAMTQIKKGTNLIGDDFRLGSLLFRRTVSDWKLEVVNPPAAP